MMVEPVANNQIEMVVPKAGWEAMDWAVVMMRHRPRVPRLLPEDVLAARELASHGVPAWYATGLRRSRNGRWVGGKKLPRMMETYLLFPGYLFVPFARLHEALPLRQVRGFIGQELACGARRALMVSPWQMQALFAADNQRHFRRTKESEPLKPGDHVMLLAGMYEGFDTEVVRLITAERIEVVLEILGSSRPVEITVDKVKRV